MADTLETNIQNPRNEAEREIADLGPWFHNLHLPGGVQTAPRHPLGDFPRFKWQGIEPHPPDITGWRVLDIGCNTGFYSFALTQKGAEVTAINLNPQYLRQAKCAAEKMGLAERIVSARCRCTPSPISTKPGGLAANGVHRTPSRRRPHQLVGTESRLCRVDAPILRVPNDRPSQPRSLSLCPAGKPNLPAEFYRSRTSRRHRLKKTFVFLSRAVAKNRARYGDSEEAVASRFAFSIFSAVIGSRNRSKNADLVERIKDVFKPIVLS